MRWDIGSGVLEFLQIRHVLVDALQILALLYCALAALCFSSSMFYLRHPLKSKSVVSPCVSVDCLLAL